MLTAVKDAARRLRRWPLAIRDHIPIMDFAELDAHNYGFHESADSGLLFAAFDCLARVGGVCRDRWT
jgi:hypothetical protein